MTKAFGSFCASCLDESMSKWVSEFTCPGFMCVPRKLQPFGHQYHTICCAISRIMYQVELVEGKDEPSKHPTKEYKEYRKTVGLFMRLTKSIWGSGRTTMLDSSFCALKGLMSLGKRIYLLPYSSRKGGTD